MSGHSKWSTIKHKKGALDAKRGKLFSKLAKEITVAAKTGGGDPATNLRLKTAIVKAKSSSMPGKNIENAIKSGTGEKEGLVYTEITYEGYGPAGIAILVECLTDNKNRTVSEVKSTFSKNGGSMGESGSVAWQFEKKGIIQIEKKEITEEELFDLAIEAGAEDVEVSEEGYTVKTDPSAFHEVSEAIKAKEIATVNQEITMVAKNLVEIDEQKNESLQKLIEKLDDLDDVQTVSSNETLKS